MAINQTRVDDGGGYAGERAALSAALKRRQGGRGFSPAEATHGRDAGAVPRQSAPRDNPGGNRFSTAEATHGRDAGPARGPLSYDVKPLTRQASPSDTSPRKGDMAFDMQPLYRTTEAQGAIRTPRR